MRGPASTKLDSHGTQAGTKRCIQCGRDVTHSKRMKDSRGHYWCYECGAADEARKGHGLMTPCAQCGKPTPPQHLHRTGQRYLCGDCHRDIATGGSSPSMSPADRIKLLLGGLAALVGIALVLLYQLGYV